MHKSEIGCHQACREGWRDEQIKSEETSRQGASERLCDDLERALEKARPRLLHLARIRGVAPDAIDDVVQETLLEAWRHLDQLSAPERFDAWLYGICRNMCRRWAESHRQHVQREGSHQAPGANDAGEHEQTEDFVDPLAPDPTEILSRQELAMLLDRALGYLPDTTRSALELYYLEEMPQREVALHLGLTINALEVRLHRARRQLRHILNSQLRPDAEALGLIPNDGANAGWQETRIWCMFCARQRLQGIFESYPDGSVNLRLRCPACSLKIGSPEQDGGLTYSGAMAELQGMRAFRPALIRTLQGGRAFWESVSQRQQCLHCGTHVEASLKGPDERIAPMPLWPGLQWHIFCPGCDGYYSTYTSWAAWFHPNVQDFMARHPRWICEPEVLVSYANQPAIRARFVDISSAARLVVLLHPQTMEVLATSLE